MNNLLKEFELESKIKRFVDDYKINFSNDSQLWTIKDLFQFSYKNSYDGTKCEENYIQFAEIEINKFIKSLSEEITNEK